MLRLKVRLYYLHLWYGSRNVRVVIFLIGSISFNIYLMDKLNSSHWLRFAKMFLNFTIRKHLDQESLYKRLKIVRKRWGHLLARLTVVGILTAYVIRPTFFFWPLLSHMFQRFERLTLQTMYAVKILIYII